MKKGIHYTDTFAPTPSEDTARVLQCLIIIMNLSRLCGDIVKAYCWAEVPPGELIALSYPPGYQRTGPDGEEHAQESLWTSSSSTSLDENTRLTVA